MRVRKVKRIIALVGLLFLATQTGQGARPVVITRALVDLNNDGRTDAVIIRMTDGRYYAANDPEDESCPSCACGAPKYKGKFLIEVQIGGKKPVSQSLNALMGGFEELEFWAEPWRIVFDDYNRDGQVDFNLGQFANCNGWAYRLLTIAGDGRISRLEIEEGNPDSEIFASDDSNSTRLIRSTTKGFYTRGYFNAATPVGFYTSHYLWNAKMRSFVFVKDVYDRNQNPKSTNKPHWSRAN
jgi:bla regulator protein BlaR1